MARVGGLVWLLGVAACGCVPPDVRAQYADFNRCDPAQVKVKAKDTASGGYMASGCGRPADFVCSPNAGCASARIMLTQRYAAQFECDVNDVNARPLDAVTWVVEGCGQTISFQCFESEDQMSEEPPLRCMVETTKHDFE